jgi:hypothetical protein
MNWFSIILLMNMFKPVKAGSVEEYLAMLPQERRREILALDGLIKRVAPSLKRHFAVNMIGYGSFKYKNYKREIVDWPIVAVASQKNYISVYVCSIVDGRYVAEMFKDKLGKVSVGKSCIRFKKLDDVNLDGLGKIIGQAKEKPGLEK